MIKGAFCLASDQDLLGCVTTWQIPSFLVEGDSIRQGRKPGQFGGHVWSFASVRTNLDLVRIPLISSKA